MFIWRERLIFKEAYISLMSEWVGLCSRSSLPFRYLEKKRSKWTSVIYSRKTSQIKKNWERERAAWNPLSRSLLISIEDKTNYAIFDLFIKMNERKETQWSSVVVRIVSWINISHHCAIWPSTNRYLAGWRDRTSFLRWFHSGFLRCWWIDR